MLPYYYNIIIIGFNEIEAIMHVEDKIHPEGGAPVNGEK